MVRSIEQAVDASFQEAKLDERDKDTGFVLVLDGDKAKETVHGFAQKAQDAARQVADKARAFEWEGSGIQRVLGRVKSVCGYIWRSLCKMASSMSIMWTGMLWGAVSSQRSGL